MHLLLCEKTVIIQKDKKPKQIVKQKQRHTSVHPRQAKKAHFGVLWKVRAIPVFNMNLHSIRISTTNVVQTNGGWEGRRTLLNLP